MKNIASKELNYIKDFLSWELLSAKKCHHFSQEETNPQRKQMFMDAAGVHHQNYNNLLTYVNQVNMEIGNTNNVNIGQGGQMN